MRQKKSPANTTEVIPHTPNDKYPGTAPDYFICKMQHRTTSEYDRCIQRHTAVTLEENGWSVLVHAQPREDTEPEGADLMSKPAPLLDATGKILNPDLWIDAGRDSRGNQMVYMPCIFCGAPHGVEHSYRNFLGFNAECPGLDANLTTWAPEEWNR